MLLNNRYLKAILKWSLPATLSMASLAAMPAYAEEPQIDAALTVSTSTQGARQVGGASLFMGPTLVTSGFSGATRTGERFIDLEGTSASLVNIDDLASGFAGQEIPRRPYFRALAKDVGQVFGLALDDADKPNLYLTATSAYGLPITGADQNRDGQEDKLLTGRADARFMDGLFGPNPDNAPGSVWKVDGETGEISLFASLKLAGTPNSGPGLGNIAYDPKSQQLFVSDLDTGMIFRLDLEGNVLEAFDHGTTARSLSGLPKVAFDPSNRLDIRDPSFDVEDPETWQFAPAERRVWGLSAHDGRLYYAVAAGPEVWSVGISPGDGGFLFDARRELALPESLPDLELSDIVFAPDNSMILAQRGERVGSFDFSKVTKARRAETFRFFRERDGSWRLRPQRYAIGFANQYRNGAGGVALGPNYRNDGQMDPNACQSVLWASGERLRLAPNLQARLSKSGQMRIDGAQAQPVDLSREDNSPPWTSYFLDYDGTYPDRSDAGLIGDVEIYGCKGIGDQTPNGPPVVEQPEPEDPPIVVVPDRPVQPKLSIDKRIVDACFVDRSTRTYRCAYSITVTNRGNRAYVDSLLITDTFAGTAVIDARVVRGRNWTCSRPIGAAVVCLNDNVRLEAGQSMRFNLSMRLSAPPRERRFTNCAMVGVGATRIQQVTAAQMLMEANGIRSGGVDGRMGPNTRRGLGELQSLLGMPVTGELSPALFSLAGTPIGERAERSCASYLLGGVAPPPVVEEPPIVVVPPVLDPPVVVPLDPIYNCDLRSTRQRGDRCTCRYSGMRKISATQCVCRNGERLVPGRGCLVPPRPIACDPVSTIQRGKACLCRYDNMIRRSALKCGCPRGTKLKRGRGCVAVNVPKPPRCDARSTVLQNNRCVCRYPYMQQINRRKCSCLPGLKFVPGRGCQKVVVTPAPRCDAATTVKKGNKCVCRFPDMRKVSAKSCACKRGSKFKPGIGCVKFGVPSVPRQVVPLLRQ